MSTQRLRCWADIVQMLYKCFVFAGLPSRAAWRNVFLKTASIQALHAGDKTPDTHIHTHTYQTVISQCYGTIFTVI